MALWIAILRAASLTTFSRLRAATWSPNIRLNAENAHSAPGLTDWLASPF